MRSVAQTDDEDEAKSWVCWKEAADKLGDAVLEQMVEGNTIDSRRNPNIPEHLGVAWPLYLQVRMVSETTKSRKRKADEQRREKETEEQDFNRAWEAGSGAATSERGNTQSSGAAASERGNTQPTAAHCKAEEGKDGATKQLLVSIKKHMRHGTKPSAKAMVCWRSRERTSTQRAAKSKRSWRQ